MKQRLKELGFTEKAIQESLHYADLFLGRVVTQYKNLYRVATANCELTAEISGKYRFAAQKPSDYPAVGDFVMIDRDSQESGKAIIHHLLTRKSIFIRKAAGTAQEIQVIAANIDIVFICISLNNDFNIRRLERYLAISWESCAVPVIVLTKSDLCEDLQTKITEIKEAAIGVDFVVTSALSGEGYKEILKYFVVGKTIAFMGSSGVGKSTLINRLMSVDIIETGEIRKDDKGRHVTTRRELFIIPGGGAVIDTPGMRELGMETVNLQKTFSEISELAENCKFKDCRHNAEPGCAVRAAIEDGLISEERLISFQKLKKEAKYEGLNSKQIEKEKINEMFSGFGGIKNARKYIKSKSKKK